MFLKTRFLVKMLSELDQVQLQLLRLVESRQDFKGFVQPSPEIPMGKEIHPKQSYQIRKRPAEFGPKLEKPEDQHANQCCPNLNLDGIGTGSDKGLDLEVLLQMFEEDFNLPTIFVDGGDRAGSQVKVVRQKDQDLSRFRILDFDPSQRVRAFLNGLETTEFNLFIFEHMAMLGDSFVSNDLVERIVFHAGDKIHPLGTPSAPEGIVGIGPIVDDDGPRGEVQLPGNLHIRDLSFAQDRKLGKVSVVIQEQVQFDCPFGPSEMGPVKDAQAQVNGSRIEANQLVFESEFLLSWKLASTSVEQLNKQMLIKLPRAMLIRIGQGRTAGSGDTQMFQLPLTASQTSGNLPEGMSSAQLAEKHGHKLSPAGESSSMSLSFRFSDGLLELDSRKQL